MVGVRGFGRQNKGESKGNHELWMAVYGEAVKRRRTIGWQFRGGAGCGNVWAAGREGRGGEGLATRMRGVRGTMGGGGKVGEGGVEGWSKKAEREGRESDEETKEGGLVRSERAARIKARRWDDEA